MDRINSNLKISCMFFFPIHKSGQIIATSTPKWWFSKEISLPKSAFSSVLEIVPTPKTRMTMEHPTWMKMSTYFLLKMRILNENGDKEQPRYLTVMLVLHSWIASDYSHFQSNSTLVNFHIPEDPCMVLGPISFGGWTNYQFGCEDCMIPGLPVIPAKVNLLFQVGFCCPVIPPHVGLVLWDAWVVNGVTYFCELKALTGQFQLWQGGPLL